MKSIILVGKVGTGVNAFLEKFKVALGDFEFVSFVDDRTGNNTIKVVSPFEKHFADDEGKQLAIDLFLPSIKAGTQTYVFVTQSLDILPAELIQYANVVTF